MEIDKENDKKKCMHITLAKKGLLAHNSWIVSGHVSQDNLPQGGKRPRRCEAVWCSI
jgi:hypothetical protein